MYNEHFGFTESPFNVTSDPRFLYSNRLYQEAFTGLRWGIKLRRGLIVMTGEAGTGKTTLLRMVSEKFEHSIHRTLIFNHITDFTELLRLMSVDFGLTNCPDDGFAMIENLRGYLTEQCRENRIVSVLFDEAQDFDLRALKELERLLNFETDNQKVLQVVLVGSPELETKLEQPELRSIRQRIALWCRLAPLKDHEVAPYIEHRLMRAGHQGRNLFDPEAVEQIALFSKGIPRLINIICDNALLAAYQAGQKSISPKIVQKVSHDLRLTKETPLGADHKRSKNFRRSKIVGVSAILALIAGTALTYFEGRDLSGVKNDDTFDMSRQTSKPVDEKPASEIFAGGFIDEISLIQVPITPDPLVEQQTDPWSQTTVRVPQKNDQVSAKVYLHTSQQSDRLVVDEVGDALRVQGYTIPETRLSSSRTQGDVRFFFSPDRQDAEKIKSIVELELRKLGYRISLDVLERDGKKFQFAALGKIEVWIPPLAKSGSTSTRFEP
jgi:type II secretory pathway predicted ATPase ExeA